MATIKALEVKQAHGVARLREFISCNDPSSYGAGSKEKMVEDRGLRIEYTKRW
jgi:hypothetical protein